MKTRKNLIAVIIAVMLMLSMMTVSMIGCAAHSTSAMYDTATEADGYYYEAYDTGAEYNMAASTYTEEGFVDFNTEEYSYIEENGFKSVVNNPLSTFAADVDTASYSNIRRVINEGKVPEADMVRIEEMLNYFKYDYTEPAEGEPFGVTMEMADCPWNDQTKLLQIGLQAKKLDAEALPPSNFVFLIDVSGSMYWDNKLPMVQKAFSLLTEQLKDEDRVSIVTYADGDKVVLEGATGKDKPMILEAINSLEAGGSTAGSRGINRAYEIAEKYFIAGGNNRILLATDGDLNVGVTSEGELTRLVKEKKQGGVYLSVLGFGTGNIKDNKMEALADNGDGNYSYIDSVAEARRVLINEMGGTLFTVAKDVKLQVDFNPAQIKGYRLIGYENRVMSAEDFNDDKKDGGEIGAGHRLTVLYEIVDKDSSFGVASATSVYQNTASDNGSDDLFTLNIRYKEPDGDTSKLLTYPANGSIYTNEMSDNMRLAAAVAETGMLLRKSDYSGSASYEDAMDMLKEIDGMLDDEYILDFYGLVKKVSDMTY